MFAKGVEQNFSTDIFTLAKVVEATANPLRITGFKQDSYTGTILPGETDSSSRLESKPHQDR